MPNYFTFYHCEYISYYSDIALRQEEIAVEILEGAAPVHIMGRDRYKSEQIWLVSTPNGTALEITMHLINIERAYDMLLIGEGDNPLNMSSVIARSDLFLADVYRVNGNKAWLKYVTDPLVTNEDQRFSVSIEAKAGKCINNTMNMGFSLSQLFYKLNKNPSI